MEKIELFLFDCKHMDPVEHKRLTGLDNTLILHNLHNLFEAGKELRIRVPLMPGINDSATGSASSNPPADWAPSRSSFIRP